MLAPLVMGAVMYFANPMFALFSPVMLVGNQVEGRRHGQQTFRQEAARFTADPKAFRSQPEHARTERPVVGAGAWAISTSCACQPAWAPSVDSAPDERPR